MQSVLHFTDREPVYKHADQHVALQARKAVRKCGEVHEDCDVGIRDARRRHHDHRVTGRMILLLLTESYESDALFPHILTASWRRLRQINASLTPDVFDEHPSCDLSGLFTGWSMD